jgi:hypothetical protein
MVPSVATEKISNGNRSRDRPTPLCYPRPQMRHIAARNFQTNFCFTHSNSLSACVRSPRESRGVVLLLKAQTVRLPSPAVCRIPWRSDGALFPAVAVTDFPDSLQPIVIHMLLHADLWFPSSRVRSRPKPLDFFRCEKILSMPSFGGEVK